MAKAAAVNAPVVASTVAPAAAATDSNKAALEGVQASVLAAKATSRAGFIYGLVGAKIRKDGKVIGSKLQVKDAQKKDVPVVGDNLEAPYPITIEAAAQAAEDCEYTVFSLVDGVEVKTPLKGIPACVAISLDTRRMGTINQRLANYKYPNVEALKTACASTFGHTVDEAPAVSSLDVLAALQKATAEGTDLVAALLQLGMKIKVVPDAVPEAPAEVIPASEVEVQPES